MSFVSIWYMYILGGHLLYCLEIWYILRSFTIFPPVLVYCIKKNLATLKRQIMRVLAYINRRKNRHHFLSKLLIDVIVTRGGWKIRKHFRIIL
jgi:hypothetical protein